MENIVIMSKKRNYFLTELEFIPRMKIAFAATLSGTLGIQLRENRTFCRSIHLKKCEISVKTWPKYFTLKSNITEV